MQKVRQSSCRTFSYSCACVRPSRHTLLFCASRRSGEELFIGPRKRGIVPEAAGIAGLPHRHAGRNAVARQHQALGNDVIVDGVTGLLLEAAHHVILADIKLPRQLVDAQLLRQMRGQILQNGDDLLVAGRGADGLQPVFLHSAPDADQKLQNQRALQQRPSERLRRLLPFQCQERPQKRTAFRSGTEHENKYSLCLCKACLQIAVRRSRRAEELGRYVENDALIRRAGRDLRPVDAAARDQNEVPRLEHIAFALDPVGGGAREKGNDLMESMIVPVHRRGHGLFQMEEPEILVQISALLIILLLHARPSSDFSDLSIAQIAHFVQASMEKAPPASAGGAFLFVSAGERQDAERQHEHHKTEQQEHDHSRVEIRRAAALSARKLLRSREQDEMPRPPQQINKAPDGKRQNAQPIDRDDQLRAGKRFRRALHAFDQRVRVFRSTFRLREAGQEIRQGADEIDAHMQQDRVPQPSRARIDVSQQHTQRKGVEKLIEIHMEQAEGQPGIKDRRLFAILAAPVDDLTPEEKLLAQRRDQQCGKRHQRRVLLRKQLQRVFRKSAGQAVGDHIADQAADVKQREADQQQLEKRLCGKQQRLRPFRRGPAQDQERKRHSEKIDRQKIGQQEVPPCAADVVSGGGKHRAEQRDQNGSDLRADLQHNEAPSQPEIAFSGVHER